MEKKSDQNKKGYRRFCQVTLIYVDETALQSKAGASQVVLLASCCPHLETLGTEVSDLFQSRSHVPMRLRLRLLGCPLQLCFAEVWRNARPWSEKLIQFMPNSSNSRSFISRGEGRLLSFMNHLFLFHSPVGLSKLHHPSWLPGLARALPDLASCLRNPALKREGLDFDV